MSRHSDLKPPICLNFLLSVKQLAQVAVALPAHAVSVFVELLGLELLLPLPQFFQHSALVLHNDTGQPQFFVTLRLHTSPWIPAQRH